MSVIAPQPAAAETPKKPQPLTKAEKAFSALLVGVGIALIFGVFAWFAVSTGGELKAKVTAITEPVGQTGTKTTETTEYSDTVVIFALTVGATLLLAGAFYGRLRTIKLGVLSIGVGAGELPPDKQQAIAEKAQEKISQVTTDPEQEHVLTAAALALAQEKFKNDYWGVIPSPPDEYLERIADEAASHVLTVAKTVS